MPRITLEELTEVGKEVVRMAAHYHGSRPKTETLLDLLLYGHLQGTFGMISRQHQIWIGVSSRPKRIDFRQRGSRPVAVEFVVRTEGRYEIAGAQNRGEINKLARLRNGSWSTRILLLLDLAPTPIPKANLKGTYDQVKTGSGKFKRHPVRVIYVHAELDYSFLWRHKKKDA